MSKTKDLRDALVSDLQAIVGTGTFNHSLGAVNREPVRHDEVNTTTAACIYSGPGGSSEPESLTNLKGLAIQNFIVRLFVRTETPNQDMDDLTDDVRDAVERSASNLLGTSNVEMATVTEWSEPTTEEGISGLTYVRDLTVEVRYIYDRGSL